jgi:RNA polymerase sigma-70 factor, ECF subfamily
MSLVDRCLTGDQQAYAELFERYKQLVYRTAYLMLGEAADADDALQEIFLKVFQALPSFDPARAGFTTWLHQITVNHCLNQRRRRGFALLSFQRLPAVALVQDPRPGEQRFADHQELRAALARLSPKLRAVAVLRYYHELSYQEIAQILDLPMGTVKSRINLALETLHQALQTAGLHTQDETLSNRERHE